MRFRILSSAAAAFDAKLVEDNLKQEEDIEDLIDDDEAAEILEAMLGLAPAATQSLQQPKKRRRSTAKVKLVQRISHLHHSIIFNIVILRCVNFNFAYATFPSFHIS